MILASVEKGLPFVLCCSVAGISRSAFFQWKAEDAAFADRIDAALARGAERRLKRIEDASDAGDWRASAWLLEHCLPQHFAKTRLEVTGADGGPLAGGVSLYLPTKNVFVETAPAAPALTEGSGDADGH
jgi:hypothetical protein